VSSTLLRQAHYLRKDGLIRVDWLFVERCTDVWWNGGLTSAEQRADSRAMVTMRETLNNKAAHLGRFANKDARPPLTLI